MFERAVDSVNVVIVWEQSRQVYHCLARARYAGMAWIDCPSRQGDFESPEEAYDWVTRQVGAALLA